MNVRGNNTVIDTKSSEERRRDMFSPIVAIIHSPYRQQACLHLEIQCLELFHFTIRAGGRGPRIEVTIPLQFGVAGNKVGFGIHFDNSADAAVNATRPDLQQPHATLSWRLGIPWSATSRLRLQCRRRFRSARSCNPSCLRRYSRSSFTIAAVICAMTIPFNFSLRLYPKPICANVTSTSQDADAILNAFSRRSCLWPGHSSLQIMRPGR